MTSTEPATPPGGTEQAAPACDELIAPAGGEEPANSAGGEPTRPDAGRTVDSAGRLVDAVDRLVDQVSHWTSSRWAASSAVGGSRADAGHEFAQRLADLEASASGQPSRPVPRLTSDLAIPDQWRVLIRDLARADPDRDVLVKGGQRLSAVRAALFPNG